MKKEESLYISIAVIVALLFMFSFFIPTGGNLIDSLGSNNTSDSLSERGTQDFFSNEYQFGFSYKNDIAGYNFSQWENPEDSTAQMVFILSPKTNSPLISQSNIQIKIYTDHNSTNTLTEWLEQTPETNFTNRINSAQQGQFIGREAIWFQTEDLTLATDNLVIKNDNSVIIFTAHYQSVRDNLAPDFIDLLQSIRFQNI